MDADALRGTPDGRDDRQRPALDGARAHQRRAEALRCDFVIGGLASDFTEQEYDAYRAVGRPPAFTDCADCGRLVVFTENLAPREPRKVCPECGIRRLNAAPPDVGRAR